MRTYTRKRPEHQLIENVHELCRLCLCKGEEGAPIFPDDSNNVCAVLALRIMICVGLEIKREECLPNRICAECLNNLNEYYSFRKKCEVSYQKLKSHILALKEKQYKIKLEQQNNVQIKSNESEEEMKFVVTFENEQPSEVSVLNLNGVATVNNFKETLSGLAKPESIDHKVMTQEYAELHQNQNASPEYSGPDIGTFLSTMLLQLGILVQQESGLVFTEQSINTLELETGDGSQVTFEIVEEEAPELVTQENIVMEHPLDNMEQTPPPDQNNIVISHITSKPDIDKKILNKKKQNVALSKRMDAWCEECSKTFATRSALTRHRRIHSGVKPYCCPTCGRGFSQREVMLRHALVHEELRPHVCAQCSKSFTQRGALAAHQRAHAPQHARALTIHRCSRCPKVFLYASGLSRHMMMHLGRVYMCGVCERQFKDKSSLMRHFKNTNHTAPDQGPDPDDPDDPGNPDDPVT